MSTRPHTRTQGAVDGGCWRNLATVPGQLAHEDGVVRPIAPQHAFVHVYQRHIIVEDADGAEQAQGGNLFDRVRAVVLAERGHDLALNVLDDVRVVLAFDDHDQRDASVHFRDVRFVDKVGEDGADVSARF